MNVQLVGVQRQQVTSSNIVYVQLPAAGGHGSDLVRASTCRTGRQYLHAQSKYLGVVLLVVGTLSVIGNVVMAASSSDWAALYLTRAVLLALVVSALATQQLFKAKFHWAILLANQLASWSRAGLRPAR